MTLTTVFQWNIDHTNVLLRQEGSSLFLETPDLQTATNRYPIDLGNNLSIDKLVGYVKDKCLPVFKEGVPHLASSLKEWRYQDRTIKLLKSGENLFWHLFYPSSAKGWNFPITLPVSKTIKEFVKTTILDPQFPPEVVKAIGCKSEFDDSVTFDLNRWTVTILNCGKSFEGHAVLALEGVNEFGPFFRYIHLRGDSTISTGVGKIENTGNTQHRYAFKGKSPTWVRSKDKVERLIKRVELEVEMQDGSTPIVHFNMLGSFIGTNPAKIADFESMADLAKFITPLIKKGLFPNDIYLLQQKVANSNWNELWIGEKRSMIAKVHVVTGRGGNPENGKVELFSYPDNCLSYVVRKLYFAAIHIEYGFLANVATPTEFVMKEHYVQEKCILPVWIEGESCVVRFDFTDEIQAKVKKAWKLSQEAVAMIDQWRWYPDVGIGASSLRELQQKNDRGLPLIVCLDSNRLRYSMDEVNTLKFQGLNEELLRTLLSVEEIYSKEKKLLIAVETNEGKKEIDLKDECYKQFVEIGMAHNWTTNAVNTQLIPELGIQGKICCTIT